MANIVIDNPSSHLYRGHSHMKVSFKNIFCLSVSWNLGMLKKIPFFLNEEEMKKINLFTQNQAPKIFPPLNFSYIIFPSLFSNPIFFLLLYSGPWGWKLVSLVKNGVGTWFPVPTFFTCTLNCVSKWRLRALSTSTLSPALARRNLCESLLMCIQKPTEHSLL